MVFNNYFLFSIGTFWPLAGVHFQRSHCYSCSTRPVSISQRGVYSTLLRTHTSGEVMVDIMVHNVMHHMLSIFVLSHS